MLTIHVHIARLLVLVMALATVLPLASALAFQGAQATCECPESGDCDREASHEDDRGMPGAAASHDADGPCGDDCADATCAGHCLCCAATVVIEPASHPGAALSLGHARFVSSPAESPRDRTLAVDHPPC